MKIALVQPDCGVVGGAVTFVDHLYRGLVRQGHEVSYVAIRGKTGAPGKSDQYKGKSHAIFLGYGPKKFKESAEFLNKHDVIHFTLPGMEMNDRKHAKESSEPRYAALLDLLHERRIATEHGAIQGLNGDIRKWWPFAGRLNCKILVSVQPSRAAVISKYNIAPSVVYVPNPYEGLHLRDKYWPDRPRRIVHAGRISSEKHVHLLAQAAPEINGEVEIYGKAEGMYWYHHVRKDCEEASAKMVAAGKAPVKLGGAFTGVDVPRILQGAALVTDLFPYPEDGLSRNYAFYEACDYGAVPILPASRFSPQVVLNQNALSCHELTSEYLRDVVNTALDDPEMLARIRQANLDYLRHHSYENTVGKYMELYKNL